MSLLERCPHFRGWYVQASMGLGPEDVSLLERCPHFREWYVQASMELGPEDVSLLERCPHFRGWYVHFLLCRFEIAMLLLRLWLREDCRQSILKACGGPKFQAFLGAIFDTLLYQLNDGLSRLVNVRQHEVAKDSELEPLSLSHFSPFSILPPSPPSLPPSLTFPLPSPSPPPILPPSPLLPLQRVSGIL